MVEQAVIRPYQEGDEVAINEGFNRTFGLERSLAEWQWKFAPYRNRRWIMVAVDSKGLVMAHYAAAAVRWQLDGRTVLRGRLSTSAPGPRSGKVLRLHTLTLRRSKPSLIASEVRKGFS